MVRVRLAETLHAVVSQRLLPRADGHGRVVAAEVMVVTATIRELILDGDKINEIRDYIAEGRDQYGMQTFDQHLGDLVQSGEVTFEAALAAATRPSDFQLKMQTFKRRSTTVHAEEVKGSEPPREERFSTGSGMDFLNG